MAENNNLPEQKKPTPVATRRIGKQQTKSERFLKFTKRFFAQFGTAMLAVAIVSYVFLQLMLNVGAILETEHASYANITDRAELEAFLFRDEHLIPATASGTNCFLVEDGEKVRRGEEIAVTYSDPADVEIQKRVSEIDKRIDVLERSSLSTGASTTNIKMIDDQIDELMLAIIRQVDANEFDKVIREKEELLILMNRRRAIINEDSYAAELSRLTHERKELTAALSGASIITESPESGYFYSNVDGYENLFTLEHLSRLTGEEFEKLSESVPDESVISSNAGKIVSSSTWYIAVAFDKRTAEGFRDGNVYPVTFQYSNNTELNMTLERRIPRTDKDMTVLVFSTKIMPEGFDYSRCQTVEIPHDTHEGIRISSSALRMKDGVTGVYVVIGSKVVFKKTEVIYTYGRYSVCKIPKNPAYPNRRDIAYSSKTELSLHDAVVIDGTDIYDGMRII
ncbi:MAG: hypothetical protein IJO64_06900 [Clostridia bacterium]|nr:hypothetical protein [Clostridia bacterium]